MGIALYTLNYLKCCWPTLFTALAKIYYATGRSFSPGAAARPSHSQYELNGSHYNHHLVIA